ncbi:DUF2510 domain-containing protein [Streptomyces sp. RGM 3693]|uniref:DUF2510 domain-containing protein n=1 Tax=Streptomyces sp. RGM 3693 TaxID=3413284 RepID=UPI003D27A81B
MTQQPAVPQGWYQDPSGAPVLRWWDGYRWTEHTQAPRQYAPQVPGQRQYPPMGGGGPEVLLSAEVLAVNQDVKWVDTTTSYSVLDRRSARSSRAGWSPSAAST